MVFSINYDKDGEIVSWQGGGDGSENVCPEGCATMQFDDVPPQMFSVGNIYTVMLKVDVENKCLIYKNPPAQLPKPIGG